MNVSETELIARYNETDQMGVIHHSNYLVWFEVGRTDFLKRFGINVSSMERQGIMLPVTEVKCKFISPARYEDEIIVRTRPIKLSYARLTFNYHILKKTGGDLLAWGETWHACTDKSLKPVNIKKRMPELYSVLNTYIENEKE